MKYKISSKQNRHGTTVILAICDASLIGKKFESKGTVLDLKTYASFYDGDKITEAQAVELIKANKNLNLVGQKAIKAAVKALGISAMNVKKVNGIPHLQVYYV